MEKLDALVDSIWRKSAVERRLPTVGEARAVGRLALRLAGDQSPTDSQRSSSGRRGVAAAALSDRTIQRQPAVCRPLTSAAHRTPPRRSLSSPAARRTSPGVVGSPASLDKKLNDRLQKLRLRVPNTRKYAAAVKKLCDDILDGLRGRYPHSFGWRICNSGSYFDKTKVVASFTWLCVEFSIFTRATLC